MPFPYIFTFYSFKGGVGRSMALMNSAYRLAGWGRHVLIVDMDLEAPGVSSFLARNHELTPPIGDHPRDVLAFLHEARIALDGEGTIEQKAARLPPLDPYLRSVLPERLAPLQPKIGQLGRLDVLGQNVEASYAERLAALNLKDLSNDRLAALSALLHFYFKAHRFPHRPLGLPEFEDPVSTPYDYILVDSRTGLTETGGLCVGPLADRLVVLTGLNDQNVEGTREVFFAEVGITPGPRQPWDDADPVNKDDPPPTLGPKPTILVASPIPVGELTFKRQRLAQLETQLGIRPLPLSYHPQLAFQETVFVRDYPEEYLAREYDSLTDRLMATVSDEESRLLNSSRGLFAQADIAGSVRALIRLTPLAPEVGRNLLGALWNAIEEMKRRDLLPFLLHSALHAHLAQAGDPESVADVYSNWGNVLSGEARTRQGEDADRLFSLAGEKFAEALRYDSGHANALVNWGNALSQQARRKAGVEADRLFALACRRFAEAVRLKPDHADAFNNWGVALIGQAVTNHGDEADRLFAIAMERCAEALRLKPDHAGALSNWGAALSAQAQTKQAEEADRLFALAGEKYAEAVRLKPDDAADFNNWGSALTDQAKTKQGIEADRLFASAWEKYAEAVRLNPDYAVAFNNWGSALSDQAQTKQGEVADRLFASAMEKYAEAARLKPDHADAYNNWGLALSDQAKTKQGEEANRLFASAMERYAEAVRLKPDHATAFNNWGAALSAQAMTKQGEEADRLFASAIDKYAEAVRLKPDHAAAFKNWGNALFAQAKTKQGEGARQLLDQARQKTHRAEEVSPGSGAYNLACLSALTDDPADAVHWLRLALQHGETTPQQIESDSDFDPVREHPLFTDFLKSLRNSPPTKPS